MVYWMVSSFHFYLVHVICFKLNQFIYMSSLDTLWENSSA